MEETFLIKQQEMIKRTYVYILNITNVQRDYYTTVCLLDHPYIKEHCKMIAIDLSKKQALDVD